MTHLTAVLNMLNERQEELDVHLYRAGECQAKRVLLMRRATELGATQSDIADAAGLTRQRVAQLLAKGTT